MASGSLSFDNASPAAGESVQLTVTVSEFNNNEIKLQASPDPGDGSDGKVVTFDDASSCDRAQFPAHPGISPSRSRSSPACASLLSCPTSLASASVTSPSRRIG